ncbi:hypothetical protein [uncultured Hymenobacter sp.]|uniref:hypothetical protein n=1 Tax=uncultured Hymenobacter sp. TaxID=170016 RepID=UPI0035CA6A5B
MKKNKVVFSVSVDDDGDCLFDVDIIRPDVKAHAYFYGDANTFDAFGKTLMAFPKNAADTVGFEVGQAGHPSTLVYLLIEAYCASPVGHTALRIIVDNNEERAAHHRFEFSIASEAASINKLGTLLVNWNVSDTPEIVWKSQIS